VSLLIYSAGSGPGELRAVPHSQRTISAVHDSYARGLLQLTAEDRMLSVTRLSTAYGLGAGLMLPLAVQAESLLFPAQPHSKALFKALDSYKPTVLFATPSLYAQLAHDAEQLGVVKPLVGLRHAIAGAEGMPEQLIPRIRAVLGTDQSIARRQRLQSLLGQKLEFEPRGRADLDFIFAPGQAGQARLLRPQLRFQYAGNVPVYTTSDAYAPDGGVSNQDLEGMVLPSMPWLVPGEGSTAALRSTAEAAAGDSTEWQSGLYAFGYDACQLALALAAAGGDPRRVHVAGLTGDLTVGGDGRVHREPYWARINRNGEPKPVGVPANLPSGAPTP